ncbi:MAG: glycine zipper 2TM domain-containing protein [Steroidobacteraceae bacterium]|nr:glycine zipper 2TM domain-containing protein [Steroidobacteraceae bacterium]MDW8260698.1 glycine zipper 2TM domain-containing protein [Gammaproteobacteria bacterium]
MSRKLWQVIGLVAATVGSATPTLADHRGKWRGDHGRHWGWYRGAYASDYDYARVIDVDPLVRRVRYSEPRRHCWYETHYDRFDHWRDDYRVIETRPHSAAGAMLLGGAIGAVIGNQFGRGDDRRDARVAGALIGMAIGHDQAGRRGYRIHDRWRDHAPRSIERCEVHYEDRWHEHIDGYRVTYEYNGRRYTTRLPYDPGNRLRVRIDVFPDE